MGSLGPTSHEDFYPPSCTTLSRYILCPADSPVTISYVYSSGKLFEFKFVCSDTTLLATLKPKNQVHLAKS
jgi:hypothetical protein